MFSAAAVTMAMLSMPVASATAFSVAVAFFFAAFAVTAAAAFALLFVTVTAAALFCMAVVSVAAASTLFVAMTMAVMVAAAGYAAWQSGRRGGLGLAPDPALDFGEDEVVGE